LLLLHHSCHHCTYTESRLIVAFMKASILSGYHLFHAADADATLLQQPVDCCFTIFQFSFVAIIQPPLAPLCPYSQLIVTSSTKLCFLPCCQFAFYTWLMLMPLNSTSWLIVVSFLPSSFANTFPLLSLLFCFVIMAIDLAIFMAIVEAISCPCHHCHFDDVLAITIVVIFSVVLTDC